MRYTFRPPPLPCDSSRLRSVSADSSHTAFRFLGAAALPPNKIARSVLHSVERQGGGGAGALKTTPLPNKWRSRQILDAHHTFNGGGAL